MDDLPMEVRAPVPRRTEDVNRRSTFAVVGAVATALLGSLCCIGPLLLVTLGIGTGLASTFEPLRPVLVGLTVALLGLGFYTVYGRREDPSRAEAGSVAGGSCTVRRSRKRDKVVLWAGTALALVLLSFPAWSKLLV